MTLHYSDTVFQIEFDGDYPLEGGKGVSNVVTAYVSRLLRAPLEGCAKNGTLVLTRSDSESKLKATC